MHSYEVEIKSLLGSEENADALRSKLAELDPGTTMTSQNKQLNHYFKGGDLAALAEMVDDLLTSEAKEKLRDMAENAKEFSVRTRERDGTVLLVVKASMDDTTSENGIARMEFEEEVSLSLDELDQRVLDAGFTYQAKWSREREEYVCKDVNVCLDKNAGYGFLAEFEKIVDDEGRLADARAEVESLMGELGVAELPQDRLARMFDFYNEHWPEYYGTDKVFNIE